MILSASTGKGHMSVAKTVKDHLNSKDVSTTIVDALEYINPLLNKTISEGYEYLAKKSPSVYKVIYNTSNNKPITRLIRGINSKISKKLLPLIEEYNPDMLITTHPFATAMASKLKRTEKIDIPVICLMTDYAPHRTWINPQIDAYVVANEDMIPQMVEMGVNKDVIYPFGIPIDDSFYMKKDKNKILEEIGMNTDVPTILIMAGSFGFGNVAEVYKKLQSIDIDFQIIIITGKNQKLYDAIENIVRNRKPKRNKVVLQLSKLKSESKKLILRQRYQNKEEKVFPKKTHMIYFTNEVDKYMRVSDLIITKPGGLTITEALACNLPMAIFDAIPGQEEENAEFLISNNMAVRLDMHKNGVETIKNLFGDTSKLETMKEFCENFDKSDSLENIHKLFLKILKTKE